MASFVVETATHCASWEDTQIDVSGPIAKGATPYGEAQGYLDGHMHLISGWQGDIPPSPDKQTARVPVARNRDGSPVTGPVIARFVDFGPGHASLPLAGGFVSDGRSAPLSSTDSTCLMRP